MVSGLEIGRLLTGPDAHRLEQTFAHLPDDHLIAVIQPANAASITLAERLGFRFERDDVTPSGIDVAIYRSDA